MELKSNRNSKTRDFGRNWSTINSATKSRETSSDKDLKVASSRSLEDLITMDSPWSKESLPRTRESYSWLLAARDIDAREKVLIWERVSEDASSETRSPHSTWSSYPEVIERSLDWLMSRRTTDLVQREPTRSESCSLSQSTLTTPESRTRLTSKSPILMSNRLSLRESPRRSRVRSIIRLQESPDYWPPRDSEERELRLPKRPRLSRETRLCLLSTERVLRKRKFKRPRTEANYIRIIIFWIYKKWIKNQLWNWVW